jgi:hypothetical protein
VSLSTDTATLTPVLGVGAHSITAVYSGDPSFQGSPSQPVSATVTAPPVPITGDVTALVHVTLRVLPRRRKSRIVMATLTINNSSGRSIQGPLNVVVRGLLRTIRLLGAAGFVGSSKTRAPFVAVNVPGGILQPGASVSTPLHFSSKPNPTTESVFANTPPQ